VRAAEQPGSVLVMLRDGPGRVLVRRLLPTVIVIILLAAALRYLGEQAGLYGVALGLTMMILFVIVVVALTLWTARTLDRTEADRRQIEAELRVSEGEFRSLVEAAPGAIVITDEDGRIAFVNDHTEVLFGYQRSELLGHSVEMLVPERFRGAHVSHRGAYRSLPSQRPMGSGLDLVARRRDGSEFPIDVSLGPLESKDGLRVISVLHDISERKRADVERQLLEEKLQQAHRVEAIGRLTGGIAHDFNNLLTVISGYTEILLRRLAPETEESKEIAEINKAAERAAQLTRQLLAYSRKQNLNPTVLDLNNVVTETQTMLERLIGENIEFTTALAEDLGSISADNGQIEQIIMNLALNARDAMPEGGKLLLATGNITLAHGSTNRRPDMTPGDYVVFAVTDSGQGMDAATVARIFEPYYTTKARGAGTGLGLSTVYGIVEQSCGYIEVESEPGMGTTFRLYFPQVAEKAEAFSPKPPDERPLTGSETILLVEDEEALRGVGREILQMYGYTVLLAADGAAGLELAQNYPHPIQLLMTDILMPRMSGIELAAQLSTLRPEMKILYTSGYNDSGDSLPMIAGARYLQKPYAMEELAHTLRELLDPAHLRQTRLTPDKT
jgi:hypothetical protein